MTRMQDQSDLDTIRSDLGSIQQRVMSVNEYMNSQMDVPGSVVAEAAGLWN